jgi:hypothetical protein
MGLDVSHDAWHGAYSAFARFREKLALLAGIPLPVMQGFFDPSEWTWPFTQGDQIVGLKKGALPFRLERALMFLPLKWDRYESDPICALLNHSDCEGTIDVKDLLPLAARLRELVEKNEDENLGGHCPSWKEAAIQFAEGCEAAAAQNEPLDFH